MNTNHYIKIKNLESIALNKIPTLDYESEFLKLSNSILADKSRYIFAYFGKKENEALRTYMLIADDKEGAIFLYSSLMDLSKKHLSISKEHFCAEKFEREMYENFGLMFSDHPWLKPVRYAHNRADKNLLQANYPFFKSDSSHLHEVAVGPIHAGVIEPGHFRFICSGEEILHLEIQLGYQHRGIESLMLENKKPSYRLALSEAIAGDTAIGHSYAYCAIMESLSDTACTHNANLTRLILLELERIANHTGNIGNLSVDIAYQPSSSIMGKLRGLMPLNMMMIISGDRFGKGILVPGGMRYKIDTAKKQKLSAMILKFEEEFISTAELLMDSDHSMNRFETCGVVDDKKVLDCGFVGISAKMSGIKRDTRQTHPYDVYKNLQFNAKIAHTGDVKARLEIRIAEVKQSVELVIQALNQLELNDEIYSNDKNKWCNPLNNSIKPNHLCVSLIEGCRGVICHVAITDVQGELGTYKVVDTSFHNWLALALACRNVAISDFPINNKSFDLSYCGHDL